MARAPTPLTHHAARTVLRERYGIEPTRVRRVSASDTTVFRIDTARGALALRRHGTHTDDEIASVMEWLDALRGTGIGAPQPVRSRDGLLVVERCTLVRWIDGRMQARHPRPVHFERLGRTMAQLHAHASRWSQPAGFTRPEWTAADVFCECGTAAPPGKDIWQIVPERHRALLRDAADRARPALDGPDRTLIHADLHLWNVVFADGRACPFDFDDCGYGALGYDVASALGERRLKPGWPDVLAAFVRGYETIRAAPDLSDLDVFILGRATGLALWATSMAETVPTFREPLPRWLAHYEDELSRLMRTVR